MYNESIPDGVPCTIHTSQNGEDLVSCSFQPIDLGIDLFCP